MQKKSLEYHGANRVETTHLEVVDGALDVTTVRWIAKVTDVDEPDENADAVCQVEPSSYRRGSGDAHCYDFCEHVAEVVKLLLERRLLRDLRGDARMDVAYRCSCAGSGDDGSRVARDDGRALCVCQARYPGRNGRAHREEHVDHILLDRFLISYRIGALADADALASEERLVDGEGRAANVKDSAVSRYPIANGDVDDVARYKIGCVNASDLTSSEHFRFVWRVLHEGLCVRSVVTKE